MIRSCDGLVRYKLAHLRSLYVLATDTPQEFAEKFNLDIISLCKAIQDGKWETQRSQYSEGDIKTLLSATRQQLQSLYENEIVQFELLTFQEKQQQEKLLRHRAQYGDLFVHDPVTGDLKLDHYNQPIPLQLPNTHVKVNIKNKVFELLEGLTRVLSAVKEAESRETVKSPTLLDKTEKDEAAMDEEVFGKRGE